MVVCISNALRLFHMGRGRALLVYWSHLVAVCCVVMHAWCPCLMHVQRPGRWVAGCSSCRRVALLLACVGGLTLLASACAFEGFLL